MKELHGSHTFGVRYGMLSNKTIPDLEFLLLPSPIAAHSYVRMDVTHPLLLLFYYSSPCVPYISAQATPILLTWRCACGSNRYSSSLNPPPKLSLNWVIINTPLCDPFWALKGGHTRKEGESDKENYRTVLKQCEERTEGPYLKFPNDSIQLGSFKAGFIQQSQIPIKLHNVSRVVNEPWFPGEENVSHFLVIFPKATSG